MFSQLLFVRIRAAEKALRAGRIDEAFRLASAPDLKANARGAAVLAELAPKFVERARGFYRGDQFAEATMDLDRAEACGTMREEINELRGYVRVVSAEQQRREASRHQRVVDAQRRIERGSLAAGKEMLEKAAHDDHAAQVALRKATERAQDAMKAADQAAAFMKAGQLSAAAERIRRAKSFDAQCEAVTRAESELCAKVLENVRGAIEHGSLSRAAAELSCLGNLGVALPLRAELFELLAVAKSCADSLMQHDYAGARRNAMMLARKMSKSKWVDSLIDQLSQLDDVYTAVAAGPLGDRFLAGGAAAARQVAPVDGMLVRPARLDETMIVRERGVMASSDLPSRLLLLVDGGGSYLILREGKASIGRSAADSPADVALHSDIAERQANIARVDDDYFLFSTREAEVNGRKVQQSLLRDGDRVVLGKKAKFTFRVPSRKTTTAVLELSDTTKMANDVRRVVLFQSLATVANGPTAHIYCRHAGPTLILFERNGGMWIRAKSDGHVDTEAKALPLGEPVEIGGINLVLRSA